MKRNSLGRRSRARRPDAAQRGQLLAAFDRSGLSAADFARRHGLHYTTFCGWRQRQERVQTSPGFVQVELATPVAPAELVIEFGMARLRLHSAAQVALAAALLRRLQEDRPC
jgi:transposase-like protein